MKNIFGETYKYGSKWGITDLFDECESLLRESLGSGCDFHAAWGAWKEIYYAEVTRENGEINLEFRAYIDDLYDLIDTLIWKAVGGNDTCESGYDWICKHHDLDPQNERDVTFAHQIMEEIGGWIKNIYQEDYFANATLPVDATYEQIMKELDKLEDDAKGQIENRWSEMVEAIKTGIENP